MKWGAAVFVFLLFLPVVSWAGDRDRTMLLADETSPTVQNGQADSDNLSRMHSAAMLKRFTRSGYLVRVPASSSHYYIHNVPSAYRYSRPWTKLFLTRLSQQFHSKFGHRLRVTSLVRTEARQLQLARRNPNAAEVNGPMRSSHLTGATIDISKRFMSESEKQWMRDVLFSLRQQGYLYAIEEFNQPTFHIMVYRSYPHYVKLVTRTRRKPIKPEVKSASVDPEQSPAITDQDSSAETGAN